MIIQKKKDVTMIKHQSLMKTASCLGEGFTSPAIQEKWGIVVPATFEEDLPTYNI
jgi:hypothetical protein